MSQRTEIERQVDGAVAEPIAVIGIGCRFPGAEGPEQLWQVLVRGLDATSEMPAERADPDAFYAPELGVPRASYRRPGGFLDRVDLFDAAFFGISPREANAMDPQQRLLLEVAWEALEDAGQVLERIGGRCGVFTGMWSTDYEDLLGLDPHKLDLYAVAGGSSFSASGRLSYCFGFEGPSLTVNTACSSSLVAVHLACQSLRLRECDLALVGGSNLVLQPQATLCFGRANLLAPDGRCKFGDRRADGFSRSEGVGAIVLKPLERARADGDQVYAVIRGSAVNNNGRSSGELVTPGSTTQEAVVRQACRMAGIAPAQLHYVEAHGTGTPVGDPIELKALGAVIAEGGRPPDRPCLVGSVKTNIGHLEGASGIAGLIKVALSLKHRQIPASLHFREPNPEIPWAELPLEIVRELRGWPAADGPLRAGLNSFGLTGTNAHVVLEEAPAADSDSDSAPAADPRVRLLAISARSPEALAAQAHRHLEFLNGQAAAPLGEICYAAGARRNHHDHRLTLVAGDARVLAAELGAWLDGEIRPAIATGCRQTDHPPKVAYVFPGQGSQWLGMGRQLLEEEPVFRQQLERCDAAIRDCGDLSLMGELGATEATSRLDRIDVVQPVLWALEVSLAALWRSWGIAPAAVVGQSMGEVAAAQVAGALSLEDGARIICRRSRLLRRVSGRGEMAMVELAFEDAQQALAGYEDRLSVAVASSFRSTVIAGDPTALGEVLEGLEQRGVFCRRVKVDVASHSPQMDPLRDDLLAALAEVEPRAAALPVYSTVEARRADGREFDAAYWVKNLRQPVRFATAIEQLSADGCDVFLELSPHPVLLPAIEQCLAHLEHRGTVLPSLRRHEPERGTMLGSLGKLYCLGHPINWQGLDPDGGARWTRLPSYPWQRQRFWFRSADEYGPNATRRGGAVACGHPLLGMGRSSSVDPGKRFWEAEVGPGAPAYLADHRVRDAVVVPAAAYLEMALASAAESFGDRPFALEDVTFEQALILPDAGSVTLQLVTETNATGTSVRISSQPAGPAGQERPWTVHARGTLRPAAPLSAPEIRDEGLTRAISAEAFYAALSARALGYGPAFRGIGDIRCREGEALGRLRSTEPVRAQADRYQVHPALLDASFQVLLAALDGDDPTATYLPVSLRRLQLLARPEGNGEFRSHAVLGPVAEDGTVAGDVVLSDSQGRMLLRAEGLRLRRLTREVEIDDWFYQVDWQEQPRVPAADEPPPGRWLLFADRGGVAQALADHLAKAGHRPLLIDSAQPEDFVRRIAELCADGEGPLHGVVHLGSLDLPAPEIAAPEAELRSELSALYLVQALVGDGATELPRLWLVTAGCQGPSRESSDLAIAQAPLWGLGGVIAHEHPALRCTRVDLGAAPGAEAIAALAEEIRSPGAEDQIALRGRERFVARLVRRVPTAAADREPRPRVRAEAPYRLEIARPGILDQLALRVAPRPRPGAGEVEIEVAAAGLNFHDVMLAMGLISDPTADAGPQVPGVECAGRISALGPGVEGFAVGDEVMAFAGRACSRFTVTDARLVAIKPAGLSSEEAAGTIAVFVTALYAIRHLGRLRRGERVLLHTASGGVGLAAIQIARSLGAEIFATAGSPEKRALLESLGIEQVMDSRSLEFAEQVLERTAGEGVDVVLNTLTGEAVRKGLEILAPYGRFLEIGRRELLENRLLGLEPFLKNLSYSAIDVKAMARERPELFADLLGEVLRGFADGTFAALPTRVFAISEAAEAFRTMAQARHVGKIVLALAGQEVCPQAAAGVALDAGATYLITGGLGGLGLEFARFLARRGARHLVLVGRSDPGEAVRPRLAELERAGVELVVARADVARSEEVATLLARIRRDLPPLRGVFHAAGLLDDAPLLQLDRERCRKVAAPKVDGAWNLHVLTRSDPLDFFVLFSSVAALLGTQGQGPYAAANAFLDALARQRRRWGLPAMSIAWGPWAEVGLAAARESRGGRLAERGLASFAPERGLAAFERLQEGDPAWVAVMPFDAEKWCRDPTIGRSPFFARVTVETPGPPATTDDFRDALKTLRGPELRDRLESHVLGEVGQVLRLHVSEIDPHQPLRAMGLDSLMSLELRNRLEASLGLPVSTTVVWNHPTTTALSSYLLGELAEVEEKGVAPAPEDGVAPASSGTDDLLAAVDEISEEDALAALRGGA